MSDLKKQRPALQNIQKHKPKTPMTFITCLWACGVASVKRKRPQVNKTSMKMRMWKSSNVMTRKLRIGSQTQSLERTPKFSLTALSPGSNLFSTQNIVSRTKEHIKTCALPSRILYNALLQTAQLIKLQLFQTLRLNRLWRL